MDNRCVTDGMMILEDGLSSGIAQQYERHRYLDSNTTNTDTNYSEGNSQFGSFSNRSSRSSSSAMRGLELPEEEMSSRFSQTLFLCYYYGDYGCIDYVEHWHPYRTIKMLVTVFAKNVKTLRKIDFFALAASSFK